MYNKIKREVVKKTLSSKVPKKKLINPDVRKKSILVKRLGMLIAVIAFLIYAQTISYNFTFDDRIIIFENSLTTQGIKAIPEIFSTPFFYGSALPNYNIYYRPVSKAVFAFCWSLSPDGPGLFHFICILFYALTGLVLFFTLVKYFSGNIVVPLISSLLFITHPIHTEVVDNIKSLDEILCFLFFIISLYFIYKYLENYKLKYLLISALSFFISFLSKESGIAYLAVFPLILYYMKRNKIDIIRISLTMVFVTIIIFGIRYMVLESVSKPQQLPSDNIIGDTDNFFVQRANAIYFMGKYLLLLIFPHPLVCDYSTKEFSLVKMNDWRFIISSVIWLWLFIYSIISLKSRNWIGFGILFFLITFSVTSNIFFIGLTHFAERFMYAPSLGFCLVTALSANRFINKQKEAEKTVLSLKNVIGKRPILFFLVLVISILFIYKTVAQNSVWENNISLFEYAIKQHPKSFRPHIAIAEEFMDQKYLQKFPKDEQHNITQRAINELKTSNNLLHNVRCYDDLGIIFHLNGQYDSSCYYYKKGLETAPDDVSLNAHLGKVLNKIKKYDEAIPYLKKAIAINTKDAEAYFGLALSYTNKGDSENGLKYFLIVNELSPKRADAWYYEGLIYNSKGDKVRGKEFLDKATALGGVKNDK